VLGRQAHRISNIQLRRTWSKRTGDVTDPLCEPYPVHCGHKEIDEFGQVLLDELSDYEGPPDDPSA
jgi:hypothetical protein